MAKYGVHIHTVILCIAAANVAELTRGAVLKEEKKFDALKSE
jgi:hypothetical protein